MGAFLRRTPEATSDAASDSGSDSDLAAVSSMLDGAAAESDSGGTGGDAADHLHSIGTFAQASEFTKTSSEGHQDPNLLGRSGPVAHSRNRLQYRVRTLLVTSLLAGPHHCADRERGAAAAAGPPASAAHIHGERSCPAHANDHDLCLMSLRDFASMAGLDCAECSGLATLRS